VAKKKRKRARRPTRSPAAVPVAAGGGSSAATDEEAVDALNDARQKAKTRPSGRGPAAPVSNRQARKEQARRERERRLKAARRRERNRRLVRWGIVLAAAAGVGVFVWAQVTADRRLEQAALAAGQRLGAGEILEPGSGIQDLGRAHSPPFVEGTGGLPATSGAHSSPLQPPPQVFESQVPEANAVHNLEHGYVIVYYQPDGPDALPDAVREELAGLVEGEDEVMMAPYPRLQEGQSLALAAWTRLQLIEVPDDADPEDAVTVTRYFIDQFRNTIAPESAA
jgi:Protein of unknown function (DUF3105)